MLWREIRAIRKRGFAESKGELFPGGGALAAPIKDFSGKTVAVMDILTPEHRYTAAASRAMHRACCLTAHGARRSGLAIARDAARQAPRAQALA